MGSVFANRFVQQYDERSRDIFGENYERLSQIKAKYDPKNIFNKLFAITPAAEA
jgi:FAD/FMN-containing dehydrogenase